MKGGERFAMSKGTGRSGGTPQIGPSAIPLQPYPTPRPYPLQAQIRPPRLKDRHSNKCLQILPSGTPLALDFRHLFKTLL
jgi:hypothetical protein